MIKRLAFLSFLFVLSLVLGAVAHAQNVNDFLRLFGAIAQQGMNQAAQAEWRRLPPPEIACLDQTLRQQGGSVDELIGRGVLSSDPRLFQLMANCRDAVAAVQPAPAQISPYVVDGLPLGSRVRFATDAYKQYQCGPSDSFHGFIWCHKEAVRKQKGSEVTHSNSILHSADGTALYVSSYIEPAFFASGDIGSEIDRLSKRFGERPREFRMPQRQGLPSAMIAVWGRIELEPLDASEESIVASGGNFRGLLVGFLGDLQQSVKAKVPIYRLAGGAGFLWAVSFNSSGRGVLRYLAADVSRIQVPMETAINSTRQPSLNLPGSGYLSDSLPALLSRGPEQSSMPEISSTPQPSEGAIAPLTGLSGSARPSGASAAISPPNEDVGPIIKNNGADSVTVVVTGRGISVDDARSDAVRQALQQTMKQLVVADRAINNNEVLRDKVISTMNGYIDNLKQKSLTRTNDGFAIEAEVTVSASRIVNFIGYAAGTTATLRGDALSADINRENAQRTARGEIFDRTLRGFPSKVMDVKILGIKPSDSNPNILRVDLEYSFKKSFEAELESTIRALGAVECRPAPLVRPGMGGSVPLIPTAMLMAGEDECFGVRRQVNTSKHDVVCLGYSSYAQCFQLPIAEYCSSCVLENGNQNRLVLFERFVDGAGQSASLEGFGNCLASFSFSPDVVVNVIDYGSYIRSLVHSTVAKSGDGHLIVAIDMVPHQAIAEVDSTGIELPKAKYLVAVPAFSPDAPPNVAPFAYTGNRLVTNVVPDPGEAQNGCALLDDAVLTSVATRSIP